MSGAPRVFAGDEGSRGLHQRVRDALAAGGFLNPKEETDALLEASRRGAGTIENLVERRLDGEPLAWIVGWVDFCGTRVVVDPGVFVPRPHTEVLVHRAISLLTETGTAVDLCTGSGAVAAAVAATRPKATILATDIDPVAIGCALRNGVDARLGHLDDPLPESLRGRVDVMAAVVPYVPTEELHLLPRDVVAHEPRVALDGGVAGTEVLDEVAATAARWLRPGGYVLMEIGGDQAGPMSSTLDRLGFTEIRVHRDDGQDRAIEARRG